VPPVVVWFFNDECEYCTELEPAVVQFAQQEGAFLARTECGIVDPETGEAQVPALMYTHPKVDRHIFVGRFCLEALRWVLHG
jgi:thiol-disulfide isomerase/thioredoxin